MNIQKEALGKLGAHPNDYDRLKPFSGCLPLVSKRNELDAWQMIRVTLNVYLGQIEAQDKE